MLLQQPRSEILSARPVSPGFFADLFSCCSTKTQTPILPNYCSLQQTGNHNNRIAYNLHNYTYQQESDLLNPHNQQKRVQMQTHLKYTKNSSRQETQMVVKTPCVITNKNQQGEIVQTPGVITQKLAKSPRPSYLNEAPRSVTEARHLPSETHTDNTLVGGNMLASTYSLDLDHMSQSRTYNMAIFENEKLNVDKAQLTQIAELAYKYGYEIGMKKGKIATEQKEKMKQMSRMRMLSDLHQLKKSHEALSPVPRRSNVIQKESNIKMIKPIRSPLPASLPLRSPSMIIARTNKQQIKGQSNINVSPVRVLLSPQLNSPMARTPQRMIKMF